MLTRRQWWRSVIFSLCGSLSAAVGLAALVQSGSVPATVAGVAAVGAGALLWRVSLPEPASTGDIALLASAPAVAKALAGEHRTRYVFLQGLALGAVLVLLTS
jgi:hypothetical protein